MYKHLKHHTKHTFFFAKALLLSFRRPAFYLLVILSFITILFFSFLFYFAEQSPQGEITSFFDAIYFSVSTLTTTGFGDIKPLTFWGKLLSMFMMLIGTVLFVSFTAVLASSILEIELKMNKQDK